MKLDKKAGISQKTLCHYSSFLSFKHTYFLCNNNIGLIIKLEQEKSEIKKKSHSYFKL